MTAPTPAERADFAGYVRSLTDAQVLAVLAKEQAANRRVYAQIARDEVLRRGLTPT